jgi:ATP-dependent DNA helicase RecG
MTYSTNPAEIDVKFLKGVGPKKAEALNEIGVTTIADLLQHFPRRYLDRSQLTPIAGVTIGSEVTVVGKVRTHGLLRARKKYYEVLITDGTGSLPLIWFGGIKYVENRFKRGMTISVSGTVTDFNGPQLVHPDYEIIFEDEDEERLHTGRIIPLYPSTARMKEVFLDSRGLRRVIKPALEQYADHMEDLIPKALVKALNLLPLSEAVRQMHYPDTFDKLREARHAMSLRELIMFEVLVIDRRLRSKGKGKPHSIARPDKEFAALARSLPFTLTKAQKRVTAEILTDLFRREPMRRLLQGDVGSGKTVVAALTMAQVARSGSQAALMAPTEMLAQQHYRTVSGILAKIPISIALLTGSTPPAERAKTVAGLGDGRINLAIGTHVLTSHDVIFHDLAYAIVDEQHRFGVQQRQTLLNKGKRPDLLVMTATPIPRTLALTAYGDLDLSVVDELPKGRKPVRTALRTAADRPRLYQFVREEVAKGHQVFIIYPLVEESLKIDLKAATKAYKEMKEGVFSDLPIGLVHGQMKQEERERTMQGFSSGDIKIMVATTVVEVGIDIPDATVMIVEHAERFGLSQLHQLRGRVGRSDKKSYCVLVTEMDEVSESYRRLEKFVATTDGFAISELDLELRGPGDLLGSRQAGMPVFRVADLAHDLNLILTARECALNLLNNKYVLSQAEGAKLNEYIRRGRAVRNTGDAS